MQVEFIRTFDGDNITKCRFVIGCKFSENIELQHVMLVANDYINISKVLGYKERIVEIQSEGGYILYLSYTNKYISLNIIEAIVRGEKKLGIIRKARLYRVLNWKDEIVKNLIENNIPFIDSDKHSLQIGYCSRSFKINKTSYYDEFNNDIKKLIKYISENEIGEIPIITVTGTNGKTTTARIIYTVLLRLGYRVGMAATGGIFVENEKVTRGDTTGYISARKLLENKDIDIVILETARGGILKRGLAFTNSSIAIITSLTEDHIGQSGVNSLDDLASIKALTIDALKSNGKVVSCLNNHVFKYLTNKSSCIFALKKDDRISKHIENGGEAVYLKSNNIIYCKDNKEIKLINIKKLPFCHYGISKSNIKNIMAASVAINYIHGNMEDVIREIDTLECNIETNRGRQNIIKIRDFTLLIDYGHNSESFNEVYTIVKELNPSKITAIIGAPGDRKDKYIQELGYISANYCDEIIIREHTDLRGRKKGETPMLLQQGALRGNINKGNVKIIEKEEDAIIYVLNKAIKNEVIVYYTQWFDIAMNKINEYLKNNGMEEITYS